MHDATRPPDWLSVREFEDLGLSLRAERPEDHDFLEQLFVAIRWQEFARAGWPDEVLRHFLADQFRIQSRHYSQYEGAWFGLVEHAGKPIGRLYLARQSGEIRIVDISLQAEVRGKGFGTALIRSVRESARTAGRIVGISVEQNNPALNLYLKLGFQNKGAEGPYMRMEYSPEPGPLT